MIAEVLILGPDGIQRQEHRELPEDWYQLLPEGSAENTGQQ